MFPAQDPALVKEIVGVSHFDIKRVRELVERQPALARASMDWGYGDWETCIDAASHVGRREIADFLITNGAQAHHLQRRDDGTARCCEGVCRGAARACSARYGPHGITLAAHARAGGPDAAAVLQFLTSLGDADTPLTTVPITTADRDALVGKYVYGSGPRDYFTIDVQRDQLGIDRPGGPARRFLMHTGDLVFFPSGVPSAKIAFAREGGKVAQLTLADPQVLVTARRS